MAHQEKIRKINKNIFRAYDIRGIYPIEFDDYTAEQIGKVLASEIGANGKAIVAMDGRISSPELKKSLIRGLTSYGVDIIDCGMMPTPFLYFASKFLDVPNAFMITGSHNPKNYNGIKMIINNRPLYGKGIDSLYANIANINKNNTIKSGLVKKNNNIISAYIKEVKKNINIKIDSSIVVDCMNGVTGKVIEEVLRSFNVDAKFINKNVDGDFPKHSPDPTKEENLSELKSVVSSQGSKYGVAFDGDGDRLVVVESNGNCIWPDELMILFTKSILSKHRGCKIVYDVKCTRNLKLTIESGGGIPIETRTGHSFVKRKIQEESALLGGELSGHIFFNDKWYGFDDGIYVFLRFLEIITEEETLLCELSKIKKMYSTPEIDIEFNNNDHHEFMAKLRGVDDFENYDISEIDGIKISNKTSWGLVRASNTSPKITLRFESSSQDELNKIKNKIKSAILKINNKLDLPF